MTSRNHKNRFSYPRSPPPTFPCKYSTTMIYITDQFSLGFADQISASQQALHLPVSTSHLLPIVHNSQCNSDLKRYLWVVTAALTGFTPLLETVPLSSFLGSSRFASKRLFWLRQLLLLFRPWLRLGQELGTNPNFPVGLVEKGQRSRLL